MNREFDIDNILAEIKIKKGEEHSPRQSAQAEVPYTAPRTQRREEREAAPADEYYEAPMQRGPRQAGRAAAQPTRPAQPAQPERTMQSPRPRQEEYYAEYEPIRPARKAQQYAEETQYEPASAIFALAHEQEERAERKRAPQQEQAARYAQATHRGREREYREELPRGGYPTQEEYQPREERRGAEQRERQPIQQHPQPRYEKSYKPSYENNYQERYAPERKQTQGPSRTQGVAQSQEASPMRSTGRAPAASQGQQGQAPAAQPRYGYGGRQEPGAYREPERGQRPDEKNMRAQSEERFEVHFEESVEDRPSGRESFRLDYEAEYVGREAFGGSPPKKAKGFGRRRDDEEEDELIAKFSQVTPLGARKVPRIDRDHVRGHFGEAESISPQMPKPKPYQRAAEQEMMQQALPKPELKGGFRMEPGPSYGRDDATRMDLPIAGSSGGFEHTDLDDTRSLAPFDYEMDEELPPEDDDPDYDDQPATAPLDEFGTPDEAGEVREDLATLRRGLMLRFSVTAICTLCLLYLGLCQVLLLPVPGFLAPGDAPLPYAAVSVGLLVLAAIMCHSTISGGITSLFTLRANNDSLTAVTTLACVMQGVAVLLAPSALGGVQLYAAAAAVGLLLNTVGRLFTLGRVNGNFRFISSGTQKYTVQALQERELGRELTWDMNIEEAHVAYSTRTDFVEDFIGQSYAGDTTEHIARISSPIIFLASIAVAVFTYVMGADIFMTLSVFAAVLCIASPLTATIVGSMPLHKAYRSLSRRGAALSGYNAVERFAETNVVLADACDLFTSEEVLLHNIKTFAKTRIDDAILDAASVLCMCNGAVKNIFLRIIQGNTKMLKYVENIVYEDAMGISAWVSGKRVLIGNSDLMKHHGIDTPSRDYEAKYRTEDRDILYLANSGELTAMFVISYVANREVDEALDDLARKGISVVVRSVDPNLTATKIARIYDLPDEMVRILPAKLHMEYESLCGLERERDTGYITHSGTFLGFARAVSAAGAVRVATNVGLIVQTVGMVLGYALVTFFSFMGAMDQAGLATVLVFQTIWSAAVWMFAGLRKI